MSTAGLLQFNDSLSRACSAHGGDDLAVGPALPGGQCQLGCSSLASAPGGGSAQMGLCRRPSTWCARQALAAWPTASAAQEGRTTSAGLPKPGERTRFRADCRDRGAGVGIGEGGARHSAGAQGALRKDWREQAGMECAASTVTLPCSDPHTVTCRLRIQQPTTCAPSKHRSSRSKRRCLGTLLQQGAAERMSRVAQTWRSSASTLQRLLHVAQMGQRLAVPPCAAGAAAAGGSQHSTGRAERVRAGFQCGSAAGGACPLSRLGKPAWFQGIVQRASSAA